MPPSLSFNIFVGLRPPNVPCRAPVYTLVNKQCKRTRLRSSTYGCARSMRRRRHHLRYRSGAKTVDHVGRSHSQYRRSVSRLLLFIIHTMLTTRRVPERASSSTVRRTRLIIILSRCLYTHFCNNNKKIHTYAL